MNPVTSADIDEVAQEIDRRGRVSLIMKGKLLWTNILLMHALLRKEISRACLW